MCIVPLINMCNMFFFGSRLNLNDASIFTVTMYTCHGMVHVLCMHQSTSKNLLDLHPFSLSK